MPLLPPTYIGSLDPTNPRGTDSRTISDDYHRMIQESCRQTLPNLTGAVSSTHQDLNLLSGLAAGGAKLMTGNGGSTVGLFLQATAPIGWTIITGFDGRSIIVKGDIGGAPVGGGAVGGSDDPGIMNKVPSHVHPLTDPGHSHLEEGVQPLGQADARSGIPVVQAQAQTTGSAVTGITMSPPAGASNWTPKYAAAIACQLDA